MRFGDVDVDVVANRMRTLLDDADKKYRAGEHLETWLAVSDFERYVHGFRSLGMIAEVGTRFENGFPRIGSVKIGREIVVIDGVLDREKLRRAFAR